MESAEEQESLIYASFLVVCVNDWTLDTLLNFLIREGKITYWRLLNSTKIREECKEIQTQFSLFYRKYVEEEVEEEEEAHKDQELPIQNIMPKSALQGVLLLVDNRVEDLDELLPTSLGQKLASYIKEQQQCEQEKRRIVSNEEISGAFGVVCLFFLFPYIFYKFHVWTMSFL